MKGDERQDKVYIQVFPTSHAVQMLPYGDYRTTINSHPLLVRNNVIFSICFDFQSTHWIDTNYPEFHGRVDYRPWGLQRQVAQIMRSL